MTSVALLIPEIIRSLDGIGFYTRTRPPAQPGAGNAGSDAQRLNCGYTSISAHTGK